MTYIKSTAPLRVMDSIQSGFVTVAANKVLWLLGFFLIFPNLMGVFVRPHSVVKALARISLGMAVAFSLIIFITWILRLLFVSGAINRIASKITKGQITDYNLLSVGLQHFFRMLVMHIMMLPVTAAAYSLAFALPYFIMFRIFGIGGSCSLTMVLIVVFLALVLAYWVTIGMAFGYAQRYLVIENAGIFKSWKNGFSLFVRHRSFTVNLGLSLAFTNFLMSTILFVVLLMIFKTGISIPIVGLVYGIVGIIVNSFFGAPFHAAFTHGFLRIAEPESQGENSKGKSKDITGDLNEQTEEE